MNVTLPWPPSALNPNARPHWTAKAKAAKAYRAACKALAEAHGMVAPQILKKSRYGSNSCRPTAARFIQTLQRLYQLTTEQRRDRRRAALADWMAQGHSEQELRALAKQAAWAVAAKE